MKCLRWHGNDCCDSGGCFDVLLGSPEYTGKVKYAGVASLIHKTE